MASQRYNPDDKQHGKFSYKTVSKSARILRNVRPSDVFLHISENNPFSSEKHPVSLFSVFIALSSKFLTKNL